MRVPRWSVGLLMVASLIGASWATLRPLARRRAVQAARARGLELEVGAVRVGWFRVELADVRVRLEGVPEVACAARSVTANVGWSGVGDVELVGATVDVAGDVAVVEGSVRAWRTRHPTAAGGTGPSRTLRLRRATLRGRAPGREAVAVQVEELSMSGTKIVVRGADVDVALPVVGLHASGVETEVNRSDGRIGPLTMSALSLRLPASAAPLAAVAPIPDEPFVPTQADPGPSSPWAFVARARAVLGKVLARFDSGVEIKVGELTVMAPDQSVLGPWSARLVLGTDAVAFELEPGDRAGRKPLVMRALVPRDRGKWTAEVKMGPATLAELGVTEHAFGLADVGTASLEARGSVELDPDEKTFAADGSVALRGVTWTHAGVAEGALKGVDLGVRGLVASKGDLRSWSLTGGAIELGKLRFELEGGVEPVAVHDKTAPAAGVRAWASWSIPTVACRDALASMPKGLLPKLDGMEMQGTLGAHGRLSYDARVPEKTDVALFLEQKCRVTKAPPSLAIEQFKEPFDLRVYDPKGNPRVARFGPGTPGWVTYERLSPFVVDALTTCEDGAFFSHNGFSAGAIRSAIVANLKAGRFALGASTISMQLAKNVFLDRRKLLSRKLQEAVLTMWLEQAMSKTELLELYLNVIEFGPNLYGIGPASMHWFGRPASDLDPLEATFLVSILPAPVRRHAMWEKGEPSEAYLRFVRALLAEEHRRGKLDDDELQAAVGRRLKFHKPGDPPPAPHGIELSKGPLGKPGVDDDGFDPALSPPAD